MRMTKLERAIKVVEKLLVNMEESDKSVWFDREKDEPALAEVIKAATQHMHNMQEVKIA